MKVKEIIEKIDDIKDLAMHLSEMTCFNDDKALAEASDRLYEYAEVLMNFETKE